MTAVELTYAVVLAVIAAGVVVIPRLQAKHAERTASLVGNPPGEPSGPASL